MIEVSDIAIEKLLERNVKSVRLGVTGGGCAGYEYVFAEDTIKDGDEVIDYGKFSFLIDKNSQPYNINGDIAAGAIAKSLNSRRLLLMTNVEGVLDKEKKLVSEVTSLKILKMINDGTITGGMIPKINTCLDAVKNGVKGVAIIDGRKSHSILFEIFSDQGAGTLIRKWKI